jgi:predicted DCC family thiol-disulfide oxidoreductase YuxK
MTLRLASPPGDARLDAELPLFLYDGDCSFCQAAVDRVVRWSHPRARILPWQSVDLDSLGLTAGECDAAVQWIPSGVAARASGADAFRGLVSTGDRLARGVGRAAINPVTRPIADRLYRLVARHRHRMSRAGCSLPSGG